MPNRSLRFAPSIALAPCAELRLTPFSLCRLPTGTTRLELVTSGRSVAMSEAAVEHSAPIAGNAPRQVATDNSTDHRWAPDLLMTFLRVHAVDHEPRWRGTPPLL